MKSFASLAIMVVLAALFTSTCKANDVINAAPISASEKYYVGADSMSLLHKLSSGLTNKNFNATEDRGSRQTPSVMPELLSRLPVSKLFDVGAKTLNIARYWPAGLASLVVGMAPTTGAIVGVIAISIFIIIIWLVIYSIGVLPVGASLFSGGDYANLDPPYPVYPEMFPQPVHPAHAYGGPYNHRFQRSLADTSRTVMNAINQFELKNN